MVKPTKQEIKAFVLALLPFWIWFGYSNQTTVNDVVTSNFSINFIGILFSTIALGIVMSEWKDVPRYYSDHKQSHWILLGGIALLAAFQLVRSCGILGMVRS